MAAVTRGVADTRLLHAPEHSHIFITAPCARVAREYALWTVVHLCAFQN